MTGVPEEAPEACRRPPAGLSVRPIVPSDAAALVRFHESLSPESQRSRFFAVHPHLSAMEIERFTHVDHRDREAMVVVDGPEIVAVGRYDRLPEDVRAEVAFVTRDDHRGSGLAGLLLDRLAAAARPLGITGFVAETLPENRRMLGVFTRSGLLTATGYKGGVVNVTLSLVDHEPTPRTT